MELMWERMKVNDMRRGWFNSIQRRLSGTGSTLDDIRSTSCNAIPPKMQQGKLRIGSMNSYRQLTSKNNCRQFWSRCEGCHERLEQ